MLDITLNALQGSGAGRGAGLLTWALPLSRYGRWVSIYAAFAVLLALELAFVPAVDVAENEVGGNWHGSGSPVMGGQGGGELADWGFTHRVPPPLSSCVSTPFQRRSWSW